MNRPDAPGPQSNGLYTHPNTHVRIDSGEPAASSWLNGQGALVFGGATGAGAAVVKALAEAGAYVTIADSAANEGQRLMLECVGRNLRVQYMFTNLPVFRSQAEAIHHAAIFSPTATVSVVVCSAVPPPSTPQSPHLSLLSWLRTTTTDSVFPNPIPAPPTTPLNRAVTATYNAIHHALHHFRQSPPLIPLQQQQQRNYGSNGHQLDQSFHHNAASTSPKSASSSQRSHVGNLSPTSFKTAGTSTSTSAPPSHAPPPPPPPPPPTLQLDPSTALHAHPVRRSENGETSTSPTVPTVPGVLTLPALPSPVVSPGGAAGAEEELTELPLPLPSPSSLVGGLDESLHTLPLMASLPPNERKHLVVLAPEAYLPPSPSDELSHGGNNDDSDSPSVYDGSDRSTVDGRTRKWHHRSSNNKLPPHQLAERAAAAGLRALIDALTELCETDAVGPGISIGCVGWGEEGLAALEKNGDNVDDEDALLANVVDRRCVRGVMRLLCGTERSATDATAAATAMGDVDASGLPLSRDAAGVFLNPLTTNLNPLNPNTTDILITQDPTHLASPTLLSASSITDVEADADDEASGDFDATVDYDEADSSSTTSTDLILAARSVAPSALDRPVPAAATAGGRGSKPAPALGLVREEREGEGEDEEGINALPPIGEGKGDADERVAKLRDGVGDLGGVAADTTTTTPTPQTREERHNEDAAATKDKEKIDTFTTPPAPAVPAAQHPAATVIPKRQEKQKDTISLSDADTTKPLPPLPTTATPPPSRADDLTAETEMGRDADADAAALTHGVVVVVAGDEEDEGGQKKEQGIMEEGKGKWKGDEEKKGENGADEEVEEVGKGGGAGGAGGNKNGNGDDDGIVGADRDGDEAGRDGDGDGDGAGHVSEESETF